MSSVVMGMVAQFWIGRAVFAAANLRLADQISDQPRGSAEIARALGLDPDCLYRLLRDLAGHGIFREEANRCFTHTQASATLRADHPESILNMVLAFGNKPTLKASAELEEAIRLGRSPLNAPEDSAWYKKPDERSDESVAFDAAMASVTASFAGAILAGVDFSGIEVLADVGGGTGTLLAEILAKNLVQRGILFDFPRVVAGAAPVLSRYGVSGRCEVRGGDFFKEAPDGCDGYVLKNILHGWSDENCLRILGNIHAAARKGAKVIIVENLLRGPNIPEFGKVFDLFILMTGNSAKVRTQAELRALLERAGFERARAGGDEQAGLSFTEARKKA